jgi:hypothetical protein
MGRSRSIEAGTRVVDNERHDPRQRCRGACRRGARSRLWRTGLLSSAAVWKKLREKWSSTLIVACSTAGEISGTQVLDDSLALTAMRFDHTRVRCAEIVLSAGMSSAEVGRRLAEQLLGIDLAHVFVLSDGLKVNGSELVAGLTAGLPSHVSVTGGLSGDGARFERTYVCVNRFDERPRVAAIGFYGRRLKVSFASMGGWDCFGPERRVTRSKDNILYELDGQPALDLYEQYLGEHAAALPASGLSFPLSVRAARDQPGVVRTILAIDREARSLTFAGDVPTALWAHGRIFACPRRDHRPPLFDQALPQ